jgi:hypothetical protein
MPHVWAIFEPKKDKEKILGEAGCEAAARLKIIINADGAH